MENYILSISKNNYITFKNNTSDFVEVVFTINGVCAKTGEQYDPNIRGYCFTPGLEKEIKKTAIPFRKGDIIKAHIYIGEGEYREEDIDIPPHLRKELVTKIKFTRHIQNKPMEVLETRV